MMSDFLKTARVLVVDDQPEEAMPIIEALSRIGIGCVYQRGDKVEALPQEPYEGIRLVFLDMNLGVGGGSHKALPKTVNVLMQLVGEYTMPLLVICWTKHREYVETFKDMIVKVMPGLKPEFILPMKKPGLFLDRGIQTNNDPEVPKQHSTINKDEALRNIVSEIVPQVEKYIKDRLPLNILWDWEQAVHDSITQTTQVLSETINESTNDSQQDWMNELLKLFRVLVGAELGRNVEEKDALHALFSVLNNLVGDRLNHALYRREEKSYAGQVVPQDNEQLSEDQKARINQMLLVEPGGNANKLIRPGNIYLIDEKDKQKNTLKVNIDELGDNLKDSTKEQLEQTVKYIFLEVSPPCDFAQQKWRRNRIIPGVMWPADHLNRMGKRNKQVSNLKSADYIYVSPILEGILDHSNKRNKFKLVFDFRYLTSLPLDHLKRMKPLFSIRHSILVDIQSHLARHINRPGVISL